MNSPNQKKKNIPLTLWAIYSIQSIFSVYEPTRIYYSSHNNTKMYIILYNGCSFSPLLSVHAQSRPALCDPWTVAHQAPHLSYHYIFPHATV